MTPSIDPAARTAKRAYNVLSASSVGLELGISVMIGLFVGTAMDRWLGTTPWFLILWIGFGFAAGFRGVMRAVKRADRAAAAEEAEDREANPQGGRWSGRWRGERERSEKQEGANGLS